ncbi:MAG: DUF4908 domain-containing protein, partial [Acidimicrobiales bacterium]
MRTVFTFLTLNILFALSLIAAAQNISAENHKQYSFSDGETSFVLSQPFVRTDAYDATLQMNEGGEIWTLHKSQGIGGTVVYKNDTGRVFLRVNLRGGATLYPTLDSRGIPVLQESEFRYETDTNLKPELEANLTSIEDWSRVYAYAGNKTTKGIASTYESNRNIEFANWPGSQSAYKSALIEHLTAFMADELAKSIDRIVIKIGDEPGARRTNSELIIWVNPSLGYAGRPSSEKIQYD